MAANKFATRRHTNKPKVTQMLMSRRMSNSAYSVQMIEELQHHTSRKPSVAPILGVVKAVTRLSLMRRKPIMAWGEPSSGAAPTRSSVPAGLMSLNQTLASIPNQNEKADTQIWNTIKSDPGSQKTTKIIDTKDVLSSSLSVRTPRGSAKLLASRTFSVPSRLRNSSYRTEDLFFRALFERAEVQIRHTDYKKAFSSLNKVNR